MSRREVLPIGTLVQVTPQHTDRPPYRGIVRGYDMGRTKYFVGDEYMWGLFHEDGLSWPFIDEVEGLCGCQLGVVNAYGTEITVLCEKPIAHGNTHTGKVTWFE